MLRLVGICLCLLPVGVYAVGALCYLFACDFLPVDLAHALLLCGSIGGALFLAIVVLANARWWERPPLTAGATGGRQRLLSVCLNVILALSLLLTLVCCIQRMSLIGRGGANYDGKPLFAQREQYLLNFRGKLTEVSRERYRNVGVTDVVIPGLFLADTVIIALHLVVIGTPPFGLRREKSALKAAMAGRDAPTPHIGKNRPEDDS